MDNDADASRLGRDGFALPAAILGILVVAILITAGFLISSQESRIGQASDRTVEARMLAEDGLSTVMAGTFDPTQMETFAELEVWGAPLVIPGPEQGDGSWTVRIRKVAERNYRIESQGNITEGGRLAGARRTLGTIARNTASTGSVDYTQLDDEAALRTQGGVETRGNAQIIGFDEPLSEWGGFGGDVCPGGPQDRPGVINNTGDDVDSRGSSTIDGDPPYEQVPYETPEEFMTFGEDDEAFGWDEMVASATHSLPGGNLSQVGPSHTGTGICDYSDPMNWGEPHRDPANEIDGIPFNYASTHCFNYLPIIHVSGDARMQGGGRGQGILLVDGNLDLRGGFEFYGMVLVRGRVETQGSGNRVVGSIRATGTTDLDSSDYVGGSILRYSSCAVNRSRNNSYQPPEDVFLVPVGSRSWMDLTAAGF